MAKFLSDEYLANATAALAAHSGFTSSIANTELALQFAVSEAPEGDISYYITVADGNAVMASGALSDPDLTINSTYETAVAVSKGELNTQMAFMTGKLKVEGNLAKLLMNNAMLGEFANALSDLDVEY